VKPTRISCDTAGAAKPAPNAMADANASSRKFPIDQPLLLARERCRVFSGADNFVQQVQCQLARPPLLIVLFNKVRILTGGAA
jgi:hypothetical protein